MPPLIEANFLQAGYPACLLTNSVKVMESHIFSEYNSNTSNRLGGVVVTALDSRSADPGFDSRPRHYRATTLGKLFTPGGRRYVPRHCSLEFDVMYTTAREGQGTAAC